ERGGRRDHELPGARRLAALFLRKDASPFRARGVVQHALEALARQVASDERVQAAVRRQHDAVARDLERGAWIALQRSGEGGSRHRLRSRSSFAASQASAAVPSAPRSAARSGCSRKGRPPTRMYGGASGSAPRTSLIVSRSWG